MARDIQALLVTTRERKPAFSQLVFHFVPQDGPALHQYCWYKNRWGFHVPHLFLSFSIYLYLTQSSLILFHGYTAPRFYIHARQ